MKTNIENGLTPTLTPALSPRRGSRIRASTVWRERVGLALIEFVRDGLLDQRAQPEHFRSLVPEQVPSGHAPLVITANNPGSGYTGTPTVTIAAPPNSFAFTSYWSNDGTSVAGSEPSAAVSVAVANGLFTVVLGDTTLANMMAIDAALFTQPNLQLRIWFNDGVSGSAALSPVQNVTPTPYAFFADTASNLLGT